MTYDFNGQKRTTGDFAQFIKFLENEPHVGWTYFGMKVELDPTVDWNLNCVKMRWTDLDEGFNDKEIIYNKKQFNKLFQKVSA